MCFGEVVLWLIVWYLSFKNVALLDTLNLYCHRTWVDKPSCSLSQVVLSSKQQRVTSCKTISPKRETHKRVVWPKTSPLSIMRTGNLSIKQRWRHLLTKWWRWIHLYNPITGSYNLLQDRSDSHIEGLEVLAYRWITSETPTVHASIHAAPISHLCEAKSTKKQQTTGYLELMCQTWFLPLLMFFKMKCQWLVYERSCSAEKTQGEEVLDANSVGCHKVQSPTE